MKIIKKNNIPNLILKKNIYEYKIIYYSITTN